MRVPYRIVDTLAEVVKQLDPSLPLAIDSETLGFYGEFRLIQFYQRHLNEVLIVEWPDAFQFLAMFNSFEQVYHNAHYDITTTQVQAGMHTYIPAKFECTFLASRLALPDKESYSLDNVMSYVLGYDPYTRQGLNKSGLQKSDWSKKILSDDQLVYAATDVFYLLDVYDAVSSAFEDTNYQLDKSTLKSCWLFQWHGMPVDLDRLEAKLVENETIIKQAKSPINVNSYKQVRDYLGIDASDDLFLAELEIKGDEKAKLVRKVRKLRKQNSFMEKFKRTMTDSGRILGKFKPSARSGRLTSDDQNLQQLPRALKGLFGVRKDSGRILVYVDYPQLELRTIAAIVNCAAMIDLFREGKDLHTFTADFIFGSYDQVLAACDGDEEEAKTIYKRNRQIAKTCNFSLLYGGGIRMFISILIKTAMILLTEREGNTARKKWRMLWREIFAWQERGISDWKKGKMGATPLGRKYKANRMTDHLNIENQGAGAEVAKLALHYFMRDCFSQYPKEWNVLICDFIHDSFILEVPDDPVIYEQISHDLARCAQLAWFEMSKCFKVKDVPMPINIGVDYNWGDIENDDHENVYDYTLDAYATFGEANAEV